LHAYDELRNRANGSNKHSCWSGDDDPSGSSGLRARAACCLSSDRCLGMNIHAAAGEPESSVPYCHLQAGRLVFVSCPALL